MPALLARLFGRPATDPQENPTPMTTETTTDETPADVVMSFLNQGGATVDLYRHNWTRRHYATANSPATMSDRRGFEWRCNGCGKTGNEEHLRMGKEGYSESEPKESREDANRHATTCRAMPRPTT